MRRAPRGDAAPGRGGASRWRVAVRTGWGHRDDRQRRMAAQPCQRSAAPAVGATCTARGSDPASRPGRPGRGRGDGRRRGAARGDAVREATQLLTRGLPRLPRDAMRTVLERAAGMPMALELANATLRLAAESGGDPAAQARRLAALPAGAVAAYLDESADPESGRSIAAIINWSID